MQDDFLKTQVLDPVFTRSAIFKNEEETEFERQLRLIGQHAEAAFAAAELLRKEHEAFALDLKQRMDAAAIERSVLRSTIDDAVRLAGWCVILLAVTIWFK